MDCIESPNLTESKHNRYSQTKMFERSLKPPRKPIFRDSDSREIESSRNKARLLFPVESLAHLGRSDAATVQRVLLHGDTFGVWETRRDWLPPDGRNSPIKVDLAKRIRHFLPADLKEIPNRWVRSMLDSAVLTLVRYLALLRMGPSGQGRHSFRALSPSSVHDIAYSYAPILMAVGIAKRVAVINSPQKKIIPEDDLDLEIALLSDLGHCDLASLPSRVKKFVVQECNRMEMLVELGLWWDSPSLTNRSLAQAMTGPALHNARPAAHDPHRPLPDEYIGEMGVRSFWIITELAPNLLRIGQALLKIWNETDKHHWAPITIRDNRRTAVRRYLATFEWRETSGHSIERPPFPLTLPKEKGFSTRHQISNGSDELRWPPQTYTDVMGLLGVIQSAHIFVVLLSMGARRSEILGLKRNCVVYAVDERPYANGRTFKLVEHHDGEMRDWLLPNIAAIAIEQQGKLVELGERIGKLSPQCQSEVTGNSTSNHLWAQLSTKSGSNARLPMGDINRTLTSYARTLHMDAAPGGQNLRSHRFRKTLARLVALALTQAPRLLMEVFGHTAIEMTLYYILTDKDLRAEIETVTRELRVIRAKEIVEKMVETDSAGAESNSGYGGPAAVAIHNAIKTRREQLHRLGTNWGISNTMELAELLTLQGTAWEQVRRGVICTKFPGEAGPCNKSKGHPEPSKCQSHCNHRLEEAFLREDIDGAIHDSVAAYESAILDEEPLTAAHWAAQIRAHVSRFSALREKWMRHPTVKALMNGKSPGVSA